MARLYADEDFPGPAIRRLRELGHDVLTAREAGNADRQIPEMRNCSMESYSASRVPRRRLEASSALWLMGVILAGAASFPAGCVATGNRFISADAPPPTTSIERFELLTDRVVVHSSSQQLESKKVNREAVSLRPHDSFVAHGFGSKEKWTLTRSDPQQAVFKVQGRYYSCIDPFAVWFGTPSRVSFLTVFVSPSECSDDAGTTRWPWR